MRTNPAHWTMGTVYRCREDPRIIVRNLLPFGWTWNFGHPKVYIAIVMAIVAFLAPPYIAWQIGVRSAVGLAGISVLALAAIVYVASRLARDPET